DVEVPGGDAQAVGVGEVFGALFERQARLDDARIAHEGFALDHALARVADLAVGAGGGGGGERDRAVVTAAVELQPDAQLDAVVEMELAPLVAIAGAAQVLMDAEVLRGPLAVDPAGVTDHLFV